MRDVLLKALGSTDLIGWGQSLYKVLSTSDQEEPDLLMDLEKLDKLLDNVSCLFRELRSAAFDADPSGRKGLVLRAQRLYQVSLDVSIIATEQRDLRKTSLASLQKAFDSSALHFQSN